MSGPGNDPARQFAAAWEAASDAVGEWAQRVAEATNDALDKLAALLDEGHSEQLTALLTTMARFHKYSWHNVCLIASQCPTATRVAGFHTTE